MRRTTLMAFLAGALASLLIAGSMARSATVTHAQQGQSTVGIPDKVSGGNKPLVDIDGEILVDTAVRTAAETHDAICAPAGCTAIEPMFIPGTLNVVCPDVAGNTCTYQIQIEAQVLVSNFDNGLYRFLVDGNPPNPGPTDGAGLFRWTLGDPNSGLNFYQARSYAVTAQVRNAVDFQAHNIEIDIACQNTTGAHNGCTGSSGFANARIDVLLP